MSDRKFDVNLQTGETNENLQLRIYSNTHVDLQIRDIKAFSNDQKYICLPYRRMSLSNEYKTTSLGIKAGEYRTITLIVKDVIYKTQYAVSIPLNGDEISYKKMFYEGI